MSAAAPTTTSSSTTRTRAAPITSFAYNPLPTDYSPASDCSGVYVSEGIFMLDSARTCLPRNFAVGASAFYSPAVQCPSGYTAPPGCTRSASGAASTVTTVTCCPVRGDLALSCVPDADALQGPFATLFCTWIAGPQTVIRITDTQTPGSTTFVAATLQGGEGVNAYGVRMVYQSTDLVSLSATTTTSRSASATGTNPATTSAAAGDGSTGLSTGGIVAIAVIVPLALIAIAVGLFLRYRRRKRGAADGEKPAAAAAGGYYPPGTYQDSPYGGGSAYPPTTMTATTGSSPESHKMMASTEQRPYYAPSELHSTSPPVELSTRPEAMELPGDPVHR